MHNLHTLQMNRDGQQDKQTDKRTDSARASNAVYAMLLAADVQLMTLLLLRLLLLLEPIDQPAPARLTDCRGELHIPATNSDCPSAVNV